jgi:hypothetical protein
MDDEVWRLWERIRLNPSTEIDCRTIWTGSQSLLFNNLKRFCHRDGLGPNQTHQFLKEIHRRFDMEIGSYADSPTFRFSVADGQFHWGGTWGIAEDLAQRFQKGCFRVGIQMDPNGADTFFQGLLDG